MCMNVLPPTCLFSQVHELRKPNGLVNWSSFSLWQSSMEVEQREMSSCWSILGAVYATVWVGPLLGLAQLGSGWCGLVHLHLQSGPDFNQKFGVIIIRYTLFVCYMSRPKLCFSDSRWRAMECKPRSAVTKLSQAWLTSILGWPSALSALSPESFVSVKCPFVIESI